MQHQPHFLLCRTDGLGDVVLSLPIAGWLRQKYPDCKITFAAAAYTLPLVACCQSIDSVLDWTALSKLPESEIAQNLASRQITAAIFIFPNRALAKACKAANIPMRIGTSHRWFHWLYANHRVHISRKKSHLHESQLNFQLLNPLGFAGEMPIANIPQYYDLKAPTVNGLPTIPAGKVAIILHPKSKGSAREWGLANFASLCQLLPADRFQIYLTGTEAEGLLFRDALAKAISLPHVEDLSGGLSLTQLISFIGQADGLVAASTGPLHIAAALGKVAIGIFAPIAPLWPARWAPLGAKASVFVGPNANCKACTGPNTGQACACMAAIQASEVVARIEATFPATA